MAVGGFDSTAKRTPPLPSERSPWQIDLDVMLAIMEAQVRSLFRFYSRGGKVGAVITGLMTAVWYFLVALGAVAAGYFCSVSAGERLRSAFGGGLLFTIVYWQFVPLMLISAGAGLDLKRLVIYPLSRAQLFVMDLVLRVTTGVEALMLMTGASVGLALNSRLRWWTPLAFVPFIVFNLCLASGLRAVFGRLMTGRRTRELAMLGLVGLATLPQILLTGASVRRTGLGNGWAGLAWSPWALTAEWASGAASISGALSMLAWTSAACAFGWWQLGRLLRFDGEAARAAPHTMVQASERQLLAQLTAWMRDPMAALVEKELRSLSRTPRFRVVFIMGFSFSLLIWLPMMTGPGRGGPPDSFLTLMMGYSLLLLGESCFWNVLGFDRAAAQFYFLSPAPFADVLRAKNVATGVVVTLELLAITTVALVLRMPVTLGRFAEAAAAGLVTTLLLLAAGNLGSVHMPRATDPTDVWRKAAAGKTQALAIFISPLLAGPVLLAYLARYAFDSQWAFWGAMAVCAGIACVAYWMALESAVATALTRRESITSALSAGSGPVSA